MDGIIYIDEIVYIDGMIYMDGIILYMAIAFLVETLKKLTDMLIGLFRNRPHFHYELRSKLNFIIRCSANSEVRIMDSFQTHPPKSTPLTESYTAPPNSPKTASNNHRSESVVLHLYKNGAISLGEAGEILELSKPEMLHLLSIRRIPINDTTDDL